MTSIRNEKYNQQLAELNAAAQVLQQKMARQEKFNDDMEELGNLVGRMRELGIATITYPGGIHLELGPSFNDESHNLDMKNFVKENEVSDEDLLLDPYHGLDLDQKE